MEVKVIYSPILRRSVDAVTVFVADLKKQAEAMLKTMKSHSGIGLAANQVGINKRLIVMGYENKGQDDEMPSIPFIELCNPQVVKFSKEKETAIEGCLSVPGLELPVERSLGVVVKAEDLNGKSMTVRAKGLFAKVLQHEVDHINGVLFTDKIIEYTQNKKEIPDYSYV